MAPESPDLEPREKEIIARWQQISLGAILSLVTVLLGLASFSLFAPNTKAPVFSAVVGLVLLLLCAFLLEKCFRLITGRRNRGGLMSPNALRVIALCFLAFPVVGIFTGYYRKMGTIAVYQALVNVLIFLGLRAFARKREAQGDGDNTRLVP